MVKTRQQAAYTRVGMREEQVGCGGNTPGEEDKNVAIIFSELVF